MRLIDANALMVNIDEFIENKTNVDEMLMLWGKLNILNNTKVIIPEGEVEQ